MTLKVELKNADKDILLEIVREAESYLTAQLTVALAADARAVSFTALLAGATVVALGGAVALVLESSPRWHLVGAAAAISIAFLISMVMSIWSARPVAFDFVGNAPGRWAMDVQKRVGLCEALAEQAAYYDEAINSNKGIIERNAKWMRRAIGSAMLGLAGGVAYGVLALFMGW